MTGKFENIRSGQLSFPQTELAKKKNIKSQDAFALAFDFAFSEDNNIAIDSSIQETREYYYKNFWLAGKCYKLPSMVSIVYFDAIAQIGRESAMKVLQRTCDMEETGIWQEEIPSKFNGLNEAIMASAFFLEKKKEFEMFKNTNLKNLIKLNDARDKRLRQTILDKFFTEGCNLKFANIRASQRTLEA